VKIIIKMKKNPQLKFLRSIEKSLSAADQRISHMGMLIKLAESKDLRGMDIDLSLCRKYLVHLRTYARSARTMIAACREAYGPEPLVPNTKSTYRLNYN
jgi:hypothetical protein